MWPRSGEATGTDAGRADRRPARSHLVVNSPRGRGARADGAHIRAAAGVHGIPCLTTAAAGLAAANGIARLGRHELTGAHACRSSTRGIEPTTSRELPLESTAGAARTRPPST